MSDCENMKRCSFFNTYGISGEKPIAIAGFVRIYCRESRQGECTRKVLSLVLGGPEKVPANMLLNGLVMSETNTDDWPEEAKAVRRKASSGTKG